MAFNGPKQNTIGDKPYKILLTRTNYGALRHSCSKISKMTNNAKPSNRLFRMSAKTTMRYNTKCNAKQTQLVNEHRSDR